MPKLVSNIWKIGFFGTDRRNERASFTNTDLCNRRFFFALCPGSKLLQLSPTGQELLWNFVYEMEMSNFNRFCLGDMLNGHETLAILNKLIAEN